MVVWVLKSTLGTEGLGRLDPNGFHGSAGFLRGSKRWRERTAKTAQGREVGVVKVAKKNLERSLTVSSELVPFQQIDVYAKESGFVRRARRGLRHSCQSRTGDGGLGNSEFRCNWRRTSTIRELPDRWREPGRNSAA